MFHRMTMMDFIGAYDPLMRLKSMDLMSDFEEDVCALTDDAEDDKGLRVVPGVVASHFGNMISLWFPVGLVRERCSMTSRLSNG